MSRNDCEGADCPDDRCPRKPEDCVCWKVDTGVPGPEVTDEMIEAAARVLCGMGTNFPSMEQTLAWVDAKWPRFKEEARGALTAGLRAMLAHRNREAGDEN